MCKQYQLIFITFCRTKHLTFRVLKQKKIHYFQRSDGNEPHHPDYERRSGRQYAKLLEITICQNWSQAWIEKIYFLKSANAIKFSFVAYSRCLKAPPRQKTSREMWQNFEKRMMMLADNKSPPLFPPEILHKIFQVVGDPFENIFCIDFVTWIFRNWNEKILLPSVRWVMYSSTGNPDQTLYVVHVWVWP